MSQEGAHVETVGSESGIPPFLPVRMLNEFTYCARLGYLEWVQGEFTDNDDTVEGRYHHRNVDRTRQRSRRNEDGDGEIQKIHERSVWLGSETLGLSARIDLLQGEGRRVTPIDYKRGKRPYVPRGAYEPELVQLSHKNVDVRRPRYAAGSDPARCLTLARRFVETGLPASLVQGSSRPAEQATIF